MRALRFLILSGLTAACAVPQLDTPDADAIARQDYPELRPLSELTAAASAQQVRITPAVTGGLQARAARLRARAATMRRAALSDADRQRIRAALARLRQG